MYVEWLSSLIYLPDIKIYLRAREMASAALIEEDSGSVFSTHIVTHNYPEL